VRRDGSLVSSQRAKSDNEPKIRAESLKSYGRHQEALQVREILEMDRVYIVH